MAVASPKSRILTLPEGDTHDVRGFEIAVDHSPLVRRLETVGDPQRDLERIVDGHRSSAVGLRQRRALGQLDRQEPLAVLLLEPVDRGDVLVAERGQELRLALETSQPLAVARHVLGKRLDRNGATEAGVGGPVDHAHPATPDLPIHSVGTDSSVVVVHWQSLKRIEPASRSVFAGRCWIGRSIKVGSSILNLTVHENTAYIGTGTGVLYAVSLEP